MHASLQRKFSFSYIAIILAVLILGIAFRASDSTYIPPVLPEVSDSVELWQLFHEGLPEYIKEIASSLQRLRDGDGAFGP